MLTGSTAVSFFLLDQRFQMSFYLVDFYRSYTTYKLSELKVQPAQL